MQKLIPTIKAMKPGQLIAGLICFCILCGAAEAWGCPTCKDGLAHDPATANLARGYGMSIMFMMSMPFLILAGLSSYFYWEICRARAALRRQQELSTAAALNVPNEEFETALALSPPHQCEPADDDLVTTDAS